MGSVPIVVNPEYPENMKRFYAKTNWRTLLENNVQFLASTREYDRNCTLKDQKNNP